MSNEYEQCLPFDGGLRPEDLGPAWTGRNGKAVLVAQHRRGIIGNKYAFVAFSRTDVRVDKYTWTISAIGVEPRQLETTEARVLWVPACAALYRVAVVLSAGNAPVDAAEGEFLATAPLDDVLQVRDVTDPRMVNIGIPELFTRIWVDLHAGDQLSAGSPQTFPAGSPPATVTATEIVEGTLSSPARALVASELAAVYAYTALNSFWDARTRSSTESLLATRCGVGRMAVPPSPAAAAALTGCEREGPFAMRLLHGALYGTIIPEKGPGGEALGDMHLDYREFALADRFAAVAAPSRIALMNRLRFPATAARLFAKGLDYCIATWRRIRGRKDFDTVKDPQDYGDVARNAMLASLVFRGGPLFVRQDRAADAIDLDQFGLSFSSNRTAPAFSTLVLRLEPTRKARDEWDAEWKRPDSEVMAQWDPVTKALGNRWEIYPLARLGYIGGVINYAFLHDLYLTYFEKHPDAARALDYRSGEAPIAWARRNLVGVHGLFGLDQTVYVHRALLLMLAQVEDALDCAPVQPAFKPALFGAFFPRMIDSKNISNHALGTGIDFDWTWNPMLFGAELKALGEFIRNSETEGPVDLVTPRSHAASRDLTARFIVALADRDAMENLDKTAWRARLGRRRDVAALIKSAREATEARDKLAAAASGAAKASVALSTSTAWPSTLPAEIVKAMLAAGFGWGGHYKGKRDYMHFEYPVVTDPPDDEVLRPPTRPGG